MRQRLAHDLFEGTHHILIVRGDQGEGVAGTLSAAGAPDAMDIIIGSGRHVVVDDMRDAFHVQAAGGDVGGDHNLVMAALETGQCRLALSLGAVAVQAGGAEPGDCDLAGKFLGTVLGAGEDQHRVGIGLLEQCQQKGGFQVLGDGIKGVGHGVGRAAETDGGLSVCLLTKSELVRRDLDLLTTFPGGRLRVCFSMTTSQDGVGAIVEPGAARPSRRLAAARELATAGVPVSVLVNPILPYVTERDLPALVDAAEAAGAQVGGFDMVHYLRRHVWGKVRWAYEKLGPEAVARLEQARNDPGYESEVRQLVRRTMEGRGLPVRPES